jgi:hypothetical protein
MVNFQSCLGLCAKKQKPGQHHHEHNEAIGEGTRELTCVACGEVQKIKANAIVFVCRSCQVVNRIGDSQIPLAADADGLTLRRIDSGIFQQVSDSLGGSLLGGNGGLGTFSIPSCAVCLDGVGDCVLLPCCHGGFCEDCARHIAGNAAVGGAVCPRCRRGIEVVYRIVRMLRGGLVKVVPLKDLAIGGKSGRQPPKVPPPPGYRKKQQNGPSAL